MNNEVVVYERRKEINRIAKAVVTSKLGRTCRDKTVPSTSDIKNLATGYLKSRDIFDEVLISAMPDLHYSYIMNKFSTDSFEAIMTEHEKKADVFDYERPSMEEIAFALDGFRKFVGFANLIMPGMYVFDFLHIIENAPNILDSYIDVCVVSRFKGEALDLGNVLMNEVQKLIQDYINNPCNNIDEVGYVLVREVNEEGADLYVMKNSGRKIRKEIVANEVRFYMSNDNYEYLGKSDFETLGKIRNIYRAK